MWYFITFVVALLIAYSQTPKIPALKPSDLEDLTISTAEEGKEIPVLFGTRIIGSHNVVWYGDYRVTAIKENQGGGFW